MRVVCVKTHPDPAGVKAGETYTLTRVGAKSCCRAAVVTVGLIDSKVNNPVCMCCECGGSNVRVDAQWEFKPERFRPLLGDEQHELDAIEEEVKEMELIPT
jgi:hypothetical protein